MLFSGAGFLSSEIRAASIRVAAAAQEEIYLSEPFIYQVIIDGHNQPGTVEHPRLRVYVLEGKRTCLLWCRDKQNTWQTELADGRPPEPVKDTAIAIDLPPGWPAEAMVRVYDPWGDKWSRVKPEGRRIGLPTFTRSIVVRIERPVAE